MIEDRAIADDVLATLRTGRQITPLTVRYPAFEIADAYRVAGYEIRSGRGVFFYELAEEHRGRDAELRVPAEPDSGYVLTAHEDRLYVRLGAPAIGARGTSFLACLNPQGTAEQWLARPPGPAPTIATRCARSRRGWIGFTQPCCQAVSAMNFSTEPMVTDSKPFSITQLPSHRRSCGQMRPQISGKLLVADDSS